MTVVGGAMDSQRKRSDQVRARRAVRIRKVEHASRTVKRTKPKRRRARRRYDVTVQRELGTALQLPAIPRVRLRTRIFSFVLLAGCIWAMHGLVTSDRYTVMKVEAVGNQLLSSGQIRSLSEIEGQSIFLVDDVAVKRSLEEEPEVEQAEVKVRWPNTVTVEIEERGPSVEWSDAGRIWWLSADGVAYVQHGERSDLIRVESETPVLNVSQDAEERVIDPALLESAEQLGEELPSVEHWIFDPSLGLGFDDPGGWRAVFGMDGDMKVKAKVYRAIVEKLQDENVAATFVSVEDATAPYYKVESHYSWQP